MNKPIKVASIGECMIELSPIRLDTGEKLYRQAFAGDTFNTAIYFARQFADQAEVSYITGLGADPQSDAMRQAFQSENIAIDKITMVKGKGPGLYMIESNDRGRRFFQYWRNDSAAKSMFANCTAEGIAELLSEFDLVYFSGITLAILDGEQRANLIKALYDLRHKVKVGFDPKYRPALWPDKDICRTAFAGAASISDFALVSFDDHRALWDEHTGRDVALRWHMWGAKEVVVKQGGSNCLILNNDGGFINAPPAERTDLVDPTGAGDSFAAGYLGMRALNRSITDATLMAHAIAAQVIMHPGGVINASVWKRIEKFDK